MASSFTFLGQYLKDSDGFFDHIVQVTSYEIWISFLNVETQEQSKQWMHTYSPNKTKTFIQMLSACQKADDNCFLRQEKNADSGIHATSDHNNIQSVL
jgi:hypothetical protein